MVVVYEGKELVPKDLIRILENNLEVLSFAYVGGWLSIKTIHGPIDICFKSSVEGSA